MCGEGWSGASSWDRCLPEDRGRARCEWGRSGFGVENVKGRLRSLPRKTRRCEMEDSGMERRLDWWCWNDMRDSRCSSEVRKYCAEKGLLSFAQKTVQSLPCRVDDSTC